ncbi:hypothetical protein LCGC14_0387360 [marine sediment metagenome]|uniref:Uncharacterized protein n=1 Tax=marine sediment metagenome TaxID=412755 RepID=A0A0F9T632_9ZZZZ
MKCPLLHTTYVWPSGNEELELVDCYNDGCAWWDQEHSQCSMRTISNALVKIKDGMPH